MYIGFFAVLEILPTQMLKLFDASEHMMGIGIVAIRILAIAYLLSIPGTVFAAGLQGLLKGKHVSVHLSTFFCKRREYDHGKYLLHRN
ncbi:hypothetical protein [Butyrivibrio sp. LC3010]|uniref:hypothetical protein n=1 Tax=Butyrivibrio sp. LC3010 TaxID=1280680 RepID=UPI0012DC7FE4|nr:hypothetical protein [Butyrivibrio sp. LC3010]